MTTSPSPDNMHATCLRLEMGKLETGILLMGPSGCGKSSLALQLIDQPGYGVSGDGMISARLVADDQVCLRSSGEQLLAQAPGSLKGLIEIAGFGIARTVACNEIALGFCVEYCPSADLVRLPEAEWVERSGHKVRKYRLDFKTPMAAAVIRSMALAHWGVISLIDG